MRRLFIMRKDLQMSPGKLAAQVAHCAEAYWTRFIQNNTFFDTEAEEYFVNGLLNTNEYQNYINDRFVKTICEARNKNHLLKAVEKAKELGLKENIDFGIIQDVCLTELTPEEDDGTTITGVWFKPLPDDIAHEISKKYQLYH